MNVNSSLDLDVPGASATRPASGGPPPGRVRPALIALSAAVLAPAILSLLFLIPGHKPKPHGLPIAVAGRSAPADMLARQLRGQGFDVARVPGAAAARDRVLNRNAFGAIVFQGAQPRETLIATAASRQAAMLIQMTGMKAGSKQVRDLKPLDPDDPQGTSLNLLVLPLVFTATLLALAGVGLLPRAGPARRIALAVAGAAAAGLSLMLIGRVALGVIPGPWLAEAAVFALAVLAMALAAGAFVRLVGFRALGLAFLFFTALGNPGSGLASAPQLLPPPWHPLGEYLPPGAAGEAVRNVAYFDARGSTGPLLILAGWALCGALLIVVAERRHPRGEQTELAI
ncbi:MAG: hypothetical protein QOJ07_674 [Thermoleophilaceae bacterium]|nr:hypothetical protein [Thermoleophilaceae bacterium]